MKIWQDTSSAYHPAGNKLIISPGNKLIISPVNGIPMTEEAHRELVDRKWLTEKTQRAELHNTNHTMKPYNPVDRHAQTREENKLSCDWVEKVNGSYGEPLTCGDRVYYIDHQATGSNRWRTGIILQRKADYVYSSGIRRSHGYDIYDIKNCTTVSPTRQDICKYKHTKVEREILERANKYLAEMREEFLKNDDFQKPRLEKLAEFEITDYFTAKKNSPYPQIVEETVRENPIPEPETSTQEPEVKQERLEETPKQQSTKIPRALKNLDSSLGKKWEFTEDHRRRIRVRTT